MSRSRRLLRLSPGVLLAAVLLPAQVAGQVPATCTVQLDSVGGTGHSTEVAPGAIHQFANGGVWASCHGRPTRMRADSAAYYSERGRVDFVGHTHFQDSSVTLDAQRASYFTQDERLEAYGDVHLVNRDTGSQLDGPAMTYWRAAPGVRDTAEMLATNRPTVRYRARGDTAEPYVIVGQQVRLRGDDRTWAGGNVTIDRSDFASQSDSAALDLGAGKGAFLGHAQVQGRGANAYALSGRKVLFRMTDRKLSWVEAQGLGDATSSDWRLRADTIAFDVVQEQIERGTAWGDSLRPDARSVRYTMKADSVALDTPGQRLKELRGYGKAVATTMRDSLDTQPDWVAGDSLVARFDTTKTGERTLSDLEARGSARAYYRVFEADGATLAGINYSRGKRLLAAFDDKGVHRVKVVEGGDGVYLEPAKAPVKKP